MRCPYAVVVLLSLTAIACSAASEPVSSSPAPPAAASPSSTSKSAPKTPSKEPSKPPSPAPAGSCAKPGFQLIATAYSPYQLGKDAGALEEVTCWTEALGDQIRAARSRTPPGSVLDFDPLIGAQDYSLTDFRMKPVDKDTWAVRFTNLGQPTVITWELVEESGASGNFRVRDIHTDTWRLTELLAP